MNTTGTSTTRFPRSLKWTLYVANKHQNAAQRRKMAVFRLKLHFTWRKSATEFILCEYCRHCCKAFIGLSIRAGPVTSLSGRAWINFFSEWQRAGPDPYEDGSGRAEKSACRPLVAKIPAEASPFVIQITNYENRRNYQLSLLLLISANWTECHK